MKKKHQTSTLKCNKTKKNVKRRTNYERTTKENDQALKSLLLKTKRST